MRFTVLRYVRITCVHAYMKESALASPSPISQAPPALAPAVAAAAAAAGGTQQRYQWQTRKNVVLLLVSTIAMTHWNTRCLQRSLLWTRSCFAASGVHPIIIPLWLSAEAPDATGPSLSGGRYSSPGRRVSGLGGPELMRPLLFASATTLNLLIEWDDGLISCSFDFNLLKWDLHNSLATRCSLGSDGGWNQIQIVETNRSVIEWISRDWPSAKTYPPQRVSGFTIWAFTCLRQGSRKIKNPQLKGCSTSSNYTIWFYYIPTASNTYFFWGCPKKTGFLKNTRFFYSRLLVTDFYG